jgi:TolA-binding protein
MASVYKKQGKLNEALETFNTLSSHKGDIYKDLALVESGKILEQMGRPDEAQKKYQELSTKYPNSPFIEEARSKLPEKKE